MNAKDSKVPIYIAILVAVIVIAAGGYYVLGGKTTETENGKVTPVPTTKETTVTATPAHTTIAGETPAVVTAPPKVENDKM